MTTFNQQNQTVSGNQYNIGGDLVINAIREKSDISVELQKILAEINKSTQSGQIPSEVARDASTKLQDAVVESEKEKPDPKTILDYVNGAKGLISSVASTAGLVTALTQLAVFISQFFPK